MKKIGFIKRILVAAYDSLLLFAVTFFTLALVMALYIWLGPSMLFVDPSTLENPKLIEFTDLGRMIGSIIAVIHAITMSFVFYGWFWTHGGQTLGMRAWNLYLIKEDGKYIDWNIATKRYFAAILSWAVAGLGFTWILLNQRKLSWHDILTKTQIVYVAPKK